MRVGPATPLPLLIATAAALDNGLSRTPVMGYNTWNDMRCSDVSASAVEGIADSMQSLGLVTRGYQYLNVDDCWAVRLGREGQLVEDPSAFPDGLGALVDRVHSRGLRFGIYADRGHRTCAFRPGSIGREAVHAAQFAAWGVDYLKYDSCWASGVHDVAFAQYALMRDALNATGRPMVYSLCGWNAWYAPEGAKLAHSWRIAPDCDEWANVYVAIRTNERLARYASPGGFNDPDMLVGSNPSAHAHLTPAQARSPGVTRGGEMTAAPQTLCGRSARPTRRAGPGSILDVGGDGGAAAHRLASARHAEDGPRDVPQRRGDEDVMTAWFRCDYDATTRLFPG